MPSLTKRIVDAAKPADSEFFIWCGSTPGFGIRVYPSGKRVFVCQVRVGRATRRVKIGVYGPYTVEQARQRAQEIIRAAAEGRDPQREKIDLRNAITVAELCDQYLQAATANLVMTRFGRPKGMATLKIDEGRIARHIKPLLGNLRARDVTRADVQRTVDAISEGRTRGVFKGMPRGKAVVTGGAVAATRTLGLLGGIYAWAEKRNLLPGPNPAHGIETARGIAKERTLSSDELVALGKTLDATTATSPQAAAALRLIALTGLRREEACGLRWSEIDWSGSCLRLERTKTGRSVRPIGGAARELMQSLPRSSDEWVFPNRTGAGSADLKKSIAAIFEEAGIHDARSHDLRRTFASVAADEGYSDSTIGDLLGHSRRGVTARHYIRRRCLSRPRFESDCRGSRIPTRMSKLALLFAPKASRCRSVALEKQLLKNVASATPNGAGSRSRAFGEGTVGFSVVRALATPTVIGCIKLGSLTYAPRPDARPVASRCLRIKPNVDENLSVDENCP